MENFGSAARDFSKYFWASANFCWIMQGTPRVLKRTASVESEGRAADPTLNFEAEDDLGATGAGRERRTEAPTAIKSSATARMYGVGRERTRGIRNLSRLDDTLDFEFR